MVDLLVDSGLCLSKAAARRTIGEGGAYVNNVRVSDPDLIFTSADALGGGWLLLRRGKRTLAGARFTPRRDESGPLGALQPRSVVTDQLAPDLRKCSRWGCLRGPDLVV